MRTLFQDYAVDQNGQVVTSATVYVYLAQSNTTASIYTSETGGTAVNSVTTDDTTGYFSFWVDDTDYDTYQKFKIQVVKSNYAILPVDNIKIFERKDVVDIREFLPQNFVTDGSVDYTTEIQAAIDEWMLLPRGGTLIIPNGDYKVASSLTINFSTDQTHTRRIRCEGGRLVSALTSGHVFNITNTNEKQLRNLIIDGLHIYGGINDTGAFYIHGGAVAGSFWNFVLKDVVLENVYGHGIHITGNAFEYQLINPKVTGNSTNATGRMIYLDESVGNQSSVDVYNLDTRYGEYGIYSQADDIDIFGGTCLLAQKEGAYLSTQVGGVVTGLHLENNWESAAGISSGGAGLYADGRVSIVGVYGTTNSKQKWVLDLYPANVMTVIGGVQTGSTVNYMRVRANASGQMVCIGVQGGIDTTAGSTVVHQLFNEGNTKALFGGGIGVGNAVAATTPGSVVKKVEIFDANGNSIGFIPVYSTIT